MEAVFDELNVLLAWVSWVSLGMCVAGIFLIWIMWRSDVTITDSTWRVLVIVGAVAVAANAVRIAQWIVV
ncbi:hypothetical protein DQ226_13935 [Dietzia maris]|jgi:hypothetical protein|uniref:Uncharacterized protein n=1 Tax=Dietzia maris TaxID=37915 RepID=A0A365P7T2_9ACTN|nr:hypothetical protein [Dietzia sp. UCD-THP]EYT52895.1 hypothetical protein H483_0117755 [Dietzia sp. UCD-THP]RBA32483.1 hypothetical protein DQ226_13935 [Dietzia maris]